MPPKQATDISIYGKMPKRVPNAAIVNYYDGKYPFSKFVLGEPAIAWQGNGKILLNCFPIDLPQRLRFRKIVVDGRVIDPAALSTPIQIGINEDQFIPYPKGTRSAYRNEFDIIPPRLTEANQVLRGSPAWQIIQPHISNAESLKQTIKSARDEKKESIKQYKELSGQDLTELALERMKMVTEFMVATNSIARPNNTFEKKDETKP